MTRRIQVRAHPEAVAAEAGSVWVLETGETHCGSELLRYDAHSGRLVDRHSLSYPTDGGVALAVDPDGAWVKTCAPGEGVDHVGAAGTATARVRLQAVDGVVAASGSVWAISHDGTLVEADAASGRVRHRWSRFAPLSDLSFTVATDVIVADRAGAWVLSTGRAAILRIEHGRVVRELPVDPAARPLLADARDGLWIAATDRSGTGNRLIRYDLPTGRPSATLELGTRRPVALIASGDRLCVITGDGRILFVGK